MVGSALWRNGELIDLQIDMEINFCRNEKKKSSRACRNCPDRYLYFAVSEVKVSVLLAIDHALALLPSNELHMSPKVVNLIMWEVPLLESHLRTTLKKMNNFKPYQAVSDPPFSETILNHSHLLPIEHHKLTHYRFKGKLLSVTKYFITVTGINIG